MAINSTLLGEVCHVKGQRPGSARYDPNQSPEERNEYSNLILMCPNHHTVIDDDEISYTVERLHEMKRGHEGRSAPVSDDEAALVANSFVGNENVSSIGQSGGLTAHTINAGSINLHHTNSTGSAPRQQRQVQAIEKIWQTICNLNKELGMVIFVDSVLISEEMDAYFRGNQANPFMDQLHGLSEETSVLERMLAAGVDDVAKERPFVSHRLWSVFFVIQAIFGRTGLLVTNSFKKARLRDWREDDVLSKQLRTLLSSGQIEQAKRMEIGGLRYIVSVLESRLSDRSRNEQPAILGRLKRLLSIFLAYHDHARRFRPTRSPKSHGQRTPEVGAKRPPGGRAGAARADARAGMEAASRTGAKGKEVAKFIHDIEPYQ